MNTETELDPKWQSQLRKGYLELCVLLVLRQKQSSYGLELLQLLNSSGLEINEGTLYPLLNRMHKNGWLDSTWEPPAESGHPRRFYQLSEHGTAQLPQMLHLFRENMGIVEKLEGLK